MSTVGSNVKSTVSQGEKDEAGQASVNSGEPASPTSSLTIENYPHILSLVLDYSTSSTLTTLLQCSQSTVQSTVGRIYRNLRITPEQLVTMIQLGWEPSKIGVTAGRLGESFSCYLSSALNHVHTLHLLDYHPNKELPALPQQCFESLKDVVLYRMTDASDEESDEEDELPPMLLALRFDHLYLRIIDRLADELAEPDWHYANIVLTAPPQHVKRITLLVPSAFRVIDIPTISCLPKCGGDDEPIMTSVILPWGPAEKFEQEAMLERWCAGALDPASAPVEPSFPLKFVGTEYTGVLEDQGKMIPAGYDASYQTFADWFDDLEHGTVFSLGEGVNLWWKDITQKDRIQTADGKAIDAEMDRLRAVADALTQTVEHAKTNNLLKPKLFDESRTQLNADWLANKDKHTSLMELSRLARSRVAKGYPGLN